MAQHRVMNDGMGAGARLERGEDSTAIDLPADDAASIEQMMKDLNAEWKKSNELTLTLGEESKMQVTLRAERSGGSKRFLNFTGNPLGFLNGGDNIYGSPNAKKQVTKAITKCLNMMQDMSGERMPQKVWDDVGAGNIHLLMLEFAVYSGQLADKQQILNIWHYMFRRANIWDPALHDNRYLDEILGFQHINTQFRDSFCLKKNSGSGRDRRVHSMLMAYDKEAEMVKKPMTGGVGVRVSAPADVANRLRFELSLHRPWMQSQKVGGKKIETLADLDAFVGKKYEGKWKKFIKREVESVIDEACLVKMFTFDGPTVIKAWEEGRPYVPGLGNKVSTEAWVSMLEARLEREMTTELKISKAKGTKPYRQFIKEAAAVKPMADAWSLGLDMSKVESDTED